MTNIYEILKSIGLEIPKDKKETFEKSLLENYKTSAEFDNLTSKLETAQTERDDIKSKYDEDIKQRDADIKELQEKLKNAGTDSEKLKTLQLDFETLQSNYNKAKTDYETQLNKQAYEFAIKEKTAALKFSSNSAKKAFMSDVLKEELKMKDGEILGFDDFVAAYKKSDADAFINEEKQEAQKQPKPTFSGKSETGTDSSSTESTQQEKPDRPIIW